MPSLPYVYEVTRYCQLATAAAVVYDHALTLQDEVELIWKKKWSASHFLFLANRYLGELLLVANAIVFMNDSLPSTFCSDWLKVQAWLSFAVIWTVQAIMIYRVFAMYSKPMLAAVFMVGCFAIEVAATSAILGMNDGVQVTAIPWPGIHMCAPTHASKHIYTVWIPALVFELVLFLLAFYKGWRHVLKFKGGNWWCPRLLSGILMRDTTLHFLACLVLYLGNALVWATLPPAWIEVSECFAVAVTCVMGSRLILNLREAYYLPAATEFVGHETNYYDHRYFNTDIPQPRESSFRVRRMGSEDGSGDFDGYAGGGEESHEVMDIRSTRSQLGTSSKAIKDVEGGEVDIHRASSMRGEACSSTML